MQRLSALLVVDLQPEFATSSVDYNRVLNFVISASSYDFIVATRFVRGNTNFKRYLDWEFTSEPKILSFTPILFLIRQVMVYQMSSIFSLVENVITI